jgi:tetratricopeptide (TPR) repeat protein
LAKNNLKILNCFPIWLLILFITSGILQTESLYSQDDEVEKSIELILKGKIDDVKKELPLLNKKYPEHPGIILLNAMIIEDGATALPQYKKIITKYKDSPWADRAYNRVVQYYSIIGDTNNAIKYIKEYIENNPDSQFLYQSKNALKAALFRLRNNNKLKNYNEIDLTLLFKTKEEHLNQTDEKTDTYGLQVGIYSTYESAKKELERFKQMRMQAEVREKKIANETLYAVVIGDYKTKLKAENAKPIVSKQCNCSPIIFEK